MDRACFRLVFRASLLLIAATGGMGARDAAGQVGPAAGAQDAAGQVTAAAPPAGFRLEDVGLATPESVLHDPAADVYLVSNINGNFLTADDNGFISRIAPGGRVLALKWIDGAAEDVVLHAPKGMAIIAETLYVADLEAVRMFARESGRPLGAIPIPNAKLPNDLTPAPAGGLYLSDNVAGALWRIAPDHGLTQLARGAELQGPNGLAMRGGDLLFATSAGRTVSGWNADGRPRALWQTPLGGLDGLVVLTDGSVLVSSWQGSAVYRCGPDSTVREIVNRVPAPADIGFDAGRNLILIPLFQDDAVVARPLATPPR
ncbi:MAG: hypothetical protein V1774_04025 [Candidatus Eisenbacteria bacterium]